MAQTIEERRAAARIRARQYREANPEKARAHVRAWQAANPDKAKAATKAWRAANPDRIREDLRRRDLQRSYGLTVEAYDGLLAAQGGACAICKEMPAGNRRLHVDHCHTTGAVRGLLCRGCNQGIGNFREDPKLLRVASLYASRWAATSKPGMKT